MLTKDDIPSFIDDLTKDCKGPGKFGFSKKQCKSVQDCLSHVAKVFANNNNTKSNNHSDRKLVSKVTLLDSFIDDDIFDFEIDDTLMFSPNDLSLPVNERFKWRDCRLSGSYYFSSYFNIIIIII